MTKRQTYRDRVYELSSENHGVITIAMAAEAGVPAVELRKLTQRGALSRVGRGVYEIPFLAGDNFSNHAQITEIVGKQSFVYGVSVLSMLDIGLSDPNKVHIGFAGRVRKQMPGWVLIHRVSKDATFTYYDGVRSQNLFEVLQNEIGHVESIRVRSDIEEAHRREFIDDYERAALMQQLDAHLASR